MGDVIRIGPLTMDLAGRRVETEGAEVILTRGEFDLLRTLAEAGGKIVSREMLSEAVARGEGDLRSVDALVSRLRRKLPAPEEGQLIVTAPGFGYRLGVPVRAA
ncbi:winged helix-turn-helix domain-containing protein [Phenylobacterium sp. J367]|uniref:winged helix-turn-helix domain-containing protein n=1 Tax=Phenylobacterium sp. J367 TaxID=2898435 RepID=UPI0021516A1A|nr:winged helix-turn-helix domain-containing protein [Phenylobacterium sp. J367]MCR5879702.1 winged helix-turn-helix domain-containing protein [Phenylobacterium sp. J367]